jgi:hypothetical protein
VAQGGQALSAFLSGIEAGFAAKPPVDKAGSAGAATAGSAGETAAAKGKGKGSASAALAAEVEVKVLSPQRAQNLAIGLKRLGRTSAAAVAGAISLADLTFLTEVKR